MPLIQKAYERYRDNPKVTFVLVSVDDDVKRLEKYVGDRKFAMPVVRMSRDAASAEFGVIDTPTTFYVDASGTIRYEARGMELHGDAVERVTWYIEKLRSE